MQAKSIAECYQFLLRFLFCLFLSGRFTQVLLYNDLRRQTTNVFIIPKADVQTVHEESILGTTLAQCSNMYILEVIKTPSPTN